MQSSQRSIQRRSPATDANPTMPPPAPPPSSASSTPVTSASGPRSSSGSGRPAATQRRNPSQQLSQIEKSVTHLLIATKQLLETLTQWSRHTATEGEVSDVYVRLGYEFNIACRAFTSIGVETNDLGPVPDLLRGILEETLSQEASPASLDKFLPRIRDIIINLLHGLKRKQQRLRARQAKENPSNPSEPAVRQMSASSVGSGETGITQLLEDVPQYRPSSKASDRRTGSNGNNLSEDLGIPTRSSSIPGAAQAASREDSESSSAEPNGRVSERESRHKPPSIADSSMSSSTLQDLPVLSPEEYRLPIQRMSVVGDYSGPPPPPPPKQQDALAALQRGTDLERRASRRFSAYQISKHLGASPNGVPMLPTQNSPIPNRGRDVRESLNAVRTRGSLLPTRQRSMRRGGESSPARNNAQPQTISEESSSTSNTIKPNFEPRENYSPITKTPEDKLGPSFIDRDGREQPSLGATLNGPPGFVVNGLIEYDPEEERMASPGSLSERPLGRPSSAVSSQSLEQNIRTRSPEVEQFIPENSPQPGKELTLFLQYKSKIKKFVLSDGLSDLSIARLQLAFIEKFAWNTHSNGNDLPEIYIQDSVSGVRHELEDLSDIKDHSVLVLNVEVLDEVKKHIDEGLGGLRRMVEGVRSAVDSQQAALLQVSTRQQDAALEIARIATAPPSIPVMPPNRAESTDRYRVHAVRTSTVSSEASSLNGARSVVSNLSSSSQIAEIQSLRRDLAVVRQTFTSFGSGIDTSIAAIRATAAAVKEKSITVSRPVIGGDSGRGYVNAGRKTVGEESENIVNRVDDLQDIVEDLRKDVVTRGVRPLPRQLETVSRDIGAATVELKKMQAYVRREKPIWTKIWAEELQTVCNDREFLTLQEELIADLEDDLDKATQTFALVEQATKQQNLHSNEGNTVTLRSTSRGLTAFDHEVDPAKAKDGVLGEVRALQPNHETRLEAIERAEKARLRELEDRREGAFTKELGNFVEEGKLRKSGGIEEAERLRKAKDDKNRQEAWEKQQARMASKAAKAAEAAPAAENPATNGLSASPEPESSEVERQSVALTSQNAESDAGSEQAPGEERGVEF